MISKSNYVNGKERENNGASLSNSNDKNTKVGNVLKGDVVSEGGFLSKPRTVGYFSLA